MNLSIAPNPRVHFALRFADDHLLVADKPAMVVTQPGTGHEHDSLMNGLFDRFGPRLQNLGAARDFGLLHRLDRETSGLVLVALTASAYDHLRAQFESRAVRKFYYAICSAAPAVPEGVIKKPLAEVTTPASRTPGSRSRSAPKSSGKSSGKSRYTPQLKLARISSTGKPAVSAYRTLATSAAGALLECRPLTGRLHQLRVHLESLNCPILGDDLYSPPAIAHAWHRLALHAHRLVFTHPVTGATTAVESPLPADLKKLLAKFRLTLPSPFAPAPDSPAVPVPDADAQRRD